MGWFSIARPLMASLLLAVVPRPCSGVPPPSLAKGDDHTNLLADLHYDYPVGDPRRCLQQARQTKFDVSRFEVLPGLGWDNLRNLEMGVVVHYNYSLCKVTDDGRFLLPDNVLALPIKSSYVETFAEMITSYLNSTSTTASSVNVEAGLSLAKFAASGSFSREHQTIKSKQIEDDALTTRVQLRYHRYQARLQPDPQLDTKFKDRLLNIAGHILLNKTERAIYEGELLVRDYGTHVLTSVTAGAGLVKTDFLKKSYIGTDSSDKTTILAQASASFFGIFHAGAKYSHSSSSHVTTKYNQSMTHSYITSHGGPLLGVNTTLDTWTRGVDPNLVPMDRAGDPLYFFVTEKLLPELPLPTLAELEKIVRNSVEMYYEMNTIRGCTTIKAPNFNPSANFDDGTCHSRATNLTFGGIYQTCRVVSGHYTRNNPCQNLNQPNPNTGGASCPSGYNPVKIFTGSRTSATESSRSCHRCWIFAKCCHTDQFHATASFETFWCAATGKVSQYSGYLFGGVYTAKSENPVTGASNCPENFYALNMFADLHVCLSDEYEWATGVPFGGFFSCQQGNPLAMPGVHPVGTAGMLHSGRTHTLSDFVDMLHASNGQGKSSWPKKCPDGYSQHVAAVEQGCAIHYCVQSGALTGPTLPRVKRPPYSAAPAALIEDKDNLVMFDLQDQKWTKNEEARVLLTQYSPSSPLDPQGSRDTSLSAGSAAGIGVGATLAGVLLVAVIIVLVARRQNRKQRQAYHRLRSDEIVEQRSLYGSGGNDATPDAVVSPAQSSSVNV